MIKYHVFTGPECSGKTTMANLVAKKYQLPLSKEFARDYLNLLHRKYDENDLKHIAKGQYSNEKIKAEKIICDTDILTLFLWKQEVFGKCDLKWAKKLNQYKYERFYFLCKPDMPWETDPLRENPNDRMRLYQVYKECLIHFDLNFIEIEGSIDERMKLVNNTIKIIKI